MPLYEFQCAAGHRSEELRPVGTPAMVCPCGLPSQRRPSRVALLNPPTGAGLRGLYRRFTEASAEMDHAYTRAEAVEERPIASPPLWQAAKARAAAIIAAGEAPTLAPVNQ